MNRLKELLLRREPEIEMPSPDDPVHLRVRDLHKSFASHHVLKGISLDVPRGQTTMVIGPSGSGKTVLMRQIVQLEKPNSGQILLDGLDLVPLTGLDLAAIRKKFGMVFQQSALFDSMTVFDNVAFPLREHTRLGRQELKDRVMKALKDLGVEHAHNKMPSELSGGMQKRVAVARAMVMNTQIIIYDEPTTGLDPLTARAVDDLIVETAEKFGVTTLIISHDMASVFRIADYLHFLYFGRIEASGTPEDFMQAESRATSEFMRASGVSWSAVASSANAE